MPETLAVAPRRMVSQAGHAASQPAGRELGQVLASLAARDGDGELITALRTFPAREACSTEWPDWVSPRLLAAYRSKGVHRPYSHQARAAEAVHAGRDLVIVTPTA